MKKEEQIFYVYIDRTNEEVPRVFYVGKGKIERVKNTQRNKRWTNIANKYGFTRDTILGTRDEKFAFEVEILLIKECKTFESDWEDKSGWGANYTTGGDGVSGMVGELNHRFGTTWNHTEETKKKISDAGKGRVVSEKTIQKIVESNLGSKRSEESKKKMSDTRTSKFHIQEPQKVEIREKYASGLYTYRELCEEYDVKMGFITTVLNGDYRKKSADPIKTGKSRKKLQEFEVIEIREKKSTGNYSNAKLGKEYSVDRSNIFNIVNNLTWKYLLSSTGRVM